MFQADETPFRGSWSQEDQTGDVWVRQKVSQWHIWSLLSSQVWWLFAPDTIHQGTLFRIYKQLLYNPEFTLHYKEFIAENQVQIQFHNILFHFLFFSNTLSIKPYHHIHVDRHLPVPFRAKSSFMSSACSSAHENRKNRQYSITITYKFTFRQFRHNSIFQRPVSHCGLQRHF